MKAIIANAMCICSIAAGIGSAGLSLREEEGSV